MLKLIKWLNLYMCKTDNNYICNNATIAYIMYFFITKFKKIYKIIYYYKPYEFSFYYFFYFLLIVNRPFFQTF